MKKILPIIFIFSIVAFIILSLLLPSVAANASKKRKELDVVKRGEEQLPTLVNQLLTKSNEIELVMRTFPEKKDFVSVVSAVDSLATATGVALDFHFESEEISKDAKGDTIVPVKLTIQGDYTNVMQFLKALTNSSYFFSIQSIEGDAADGIKNKNKVIVKANLYASIQ